MPRSIILDVDTGIDDALAILLALASPELDVLALTCVAGNVTLDLVVRNTLAVAELVGSEVPVAVGARKPLMKRLTTATYFHGANGLGNVELPPPGHSPVPETAPDLMTRLVRERPGEISIVAVGPLTNVALAVLKDAEFARQVEGLIVMGGAVSHPGNARAAVEANWANDPEAAAAVVGSGAPLLMVDLGATSQTVLPMDRLAPAAGRPLPPPAAFALSLLEYYGAMYVSTGAAGPVLHDPLAVGLAARPELAGVRPMHLSVETAGYHTRGASVGTFSEAASVIEEVGDHDDVIGIAPRQFNAGLARDIDASAFLDMFLSRLGLAP